MNKLIDKDEQIKEYYDNEKQDEEEFQLIVNCIINSSHCTDS